jgi:hypothetical protein
MPTPVGPIPPGPDDPDLWDWDDDGGGDGARYRVRPWRLLLIGTIVVALVLLVVVSVV